MKAVALIVSAQPELARLAVASLRKFAPEVRIILRWTDGRSADEHGATIDAIREEGIGDAEQVILFDDDAAVLSPDWPVMLWRYHTRGAEIVGGMRSRGLVNQVCIDGQIVPHAHCLSMWRGVFDAAPSFRATPEPALGYLRLDTAVNVCRGHECHVLPFTLVGGIAYYDNLWMHLGRGTSFRPRSRPREALRRLAARLGSPRAQKILRYQQVRAEYIRRATEALRG